MALRQRRVRVVALTRDPVACKQRLGPEVEAITLAHWAEGRQFDAVVNLAGAQIAPMPWTRGRRETLIASRIGTTENLLQRIATADKSPQVWVQASAVGYYGVHDAVVTLTERSAQGNDFAARLCGDWEASATKIEAAGTRLCTLRLGLVLGPGGALPGLLLPIRLGIGGPVGSGKQPFPWIHIDDVVSLILECLDNPARVGTYNAVSPQMHTQSSFGRCAATILSRPFWLAAPAFLLRLLGEVSQLFLDGQHVVPDRLLREGWVWRFPDLSEALINILTGPVSAQK